MEKMVHAERGICELEVFQFGEKGRAAPLFHTWSTQQFGERKKYSNISYQTIPFSVHVNLLFDLYVQSLLSYNWFKFIFIIN